MNATIQNMEHTSKRDRVDMEDWYDKLVKLQASQTPVEVLCVGCEVDGTFENDYHDIKVPDSQHPEGTILEAVSGFHLKKIG